VLRIDKAAVLAQLNMKIVERGAYLNEEEEIGILAFWSGSITLLDMVESNVDTLATRYENIQRRSQE
jgi:hypothetical protein